MKQIIGLALVTLSMLISTFAIAQNGDLNINGIASFEQLRKEYYIGALYLGWPGHDPAAITNMPGKKRMELHITADRWPSLRFAQMWNQLITINNPGSTLNANAADMLAFTSLPKGDLIEGDNLVIELTANNTTLVTLNGTPALRTNSPALFNMLLSSWIGQRPPSSEFKRDMLDMPKSAAINDLIARYQSVHPNDARKKAIAGWGFKLESEGTAATTAVATTTVSAISPPPAPAAPAPAPITKKPEPTKAAEPEPKPTAVAATNTPPKTVAVTAPAVDTAAQLAEQQAREAQVKAKQQQQSDLYDNYLSDVRKHIVRNVEYPKRAQKENIEGLVMMRVRVDRGGNLASFELAQSADDLLDEAAQKAVKKAAPYPKASEQLEGDTFEFLIPMVFKLAK